MGWNGTTLTYPFTKIAANGNGDLQQALHISSTSHATIFANGTINPMARYKPFVYSAAAFDSEAAREAARASVRYGFGTAPTWSASNQGAPKANYTYTRPTTYLRANDFVNTEDSRYGYNEKMCAPISVVPSGSPGLNSNYGFTVFINNQAATSQQNKTWNAVEGLTVADIIGSTYNDYYIVVCLYDTNNKSWQLVKTNVQMSSLVQNGYAVIELNHSIVTFLNDSTHTGHDVTFIVGLSPGAPSGTQQILSASQSVYSLGFEDGCDRFTVKFSINNSIMGLEGNIINNSSHAITLSNPTNVTYGGYNWVRYQIDNPIYAHFHTPTGWNRGQVYLDITINNMAGDIGTASAPSGTGGLSFSSSFGALVGERSFDQSVVSSVGSYFWMLASVPVASRYIKIDLRAYTTTSDTNESKQLTGVTVYATS